MCGKDGAVVIFGSSSRKGDARVGMGVAQPLPTESSRSRPVMLIGLGGAKLAHDVSFMDGPERPAACPSQAGPALGDGRSDGRLADRYGIKLQLLKMKAENLQFPDASFDCVFGNGVLHHVELLPTIREVNRVLRPGGIAVFVEPLAHNPVIKIYRRIAKDVRTEAEAPLRMRDIQSMRSIFPQLKHEGAWLAALLLFVYFYLIERADPNKERYWKKVIAEADRYKGMFRVLKRFDDVVLRTFPFLRRFCWNAVLICPKGEHA